MRDMGALVLILVIWACLGIVNGQIVNEIMKEKGYTKNYFWLGFFGGKGAVRHAYGTMTALMTPEEREALKKKKAEKKREMEAHKQELIDEGGWKCPCGKVNAVYVSSCACGMSKREVKYGQAAVEQKEE